MRWPFWLEFGWPGRLWTEQRTRWKFRELASLADRDVRLFYDGIGLIRRQPPLTQEWQIASTIAAVQAIRCVSSAWTLFFHGFDTQPLAIARLAGEYSLLLQYLGAHQDRAGEWLEFGDRPPLTAGQIAAQLERDGVDVYPQSARDLMHRFAHQDPFAIGMTLRADTRDDAERWTLHVGDPSEHQPSIGGLLLIQNALLLLRLHDFLAGLDDRWDRAAARETQRHIEALRRMGDAGADAES